MTIESPRIWAELPKLRCPKIRSEEDSGTVYNVTKVAFLAASPSACVGVDTKGAWLEVGKYFFPMAEVEVAGKRQMHKLPWGLTNWAIDVTATTQAGFFTFPMQIEFGTLRGCPYAEML